jgi:hypothetical protein
MKQTKNLSRKIWVKRIWVNKNEYSYISIPLEQYLAVKKDEEFKLSSNKPIMMRVEKASIWYRWYRLAKSNYKKGILFLIAAIITALIYLIVEHFLKSPKQ